MPTPNGAQPSAPYARPAALDEATITSMIHAFRNEKGGTTNGRPEDLHDVALRSAAVGAKDASAMLKRASYIEQHGLYTRPVTRTQMAYALECAIYNVVHGERSQANLDELIASAVAYRALAN